MRKQYTVWSDASYYPYKQEASIAFVVKNQISKEEIHIKKDFLGVANISDAEALALTIAIKFVKEMNIDLTNVLFLTDCKGLVSILKNSIQENPNKLDDSKTFGMPVDRFVASQVEASIDWKQLVNSILWIRREKNRADKVIRLSPNRNCQQIDISMIINNSSKININ